jgi:hypothetical protein
MGQLAELQSWQMRPEWAFADDGGLGKIILNHFERSGWPLVRIDFGAPSTEPKFFLNLRAEIYFHLAQRIQLREVRLPRDETLRTQMGWIKHLPYEGKPLQLIPKAQLPSSPDRADVAAMVFMDLPRAEGYTERQEQLARTLSPVRFAGDEDGGGVFAVLNAEWKGAGEAARAKRGQFSPFSSILSLGPILFRELDQALAIGTRGLPV